MAAKGMNKVLLLGHIGKEISVRNTNSGMCVINASLATSERVKSNDQWEDKTEWHQLVAFKRTAEIFRDYVVKGSRILVEGKLQTSTWDDKETGQKRFKTEIIVNELTLLDGAQEGSSAKGTAAPQTSQTRGSTQQQPDYDYADEGLDSSEVPF